MHLYVYKAQGLHTERVEKNNEYVETFLSEKGGDD